MTKCVPVAANRSREACWQQTEEAAFLSSASFICHVNTSEPMSTGMTLTDKNWNYSQRFYNVFENIVAYICPFQGWVTIMIVVMVD